MRPVTIDPARGFDQSVDVRVAPQGAIARVENMRVDKLGRLVLRNGYQSLGVTVKGSGTQLVPCDLANLRGDLVVLGNNSPANQTGIRAIYKYLPDARGIWRTELDGNTLDNTNDWLQVPAADSVAVVLSDAFASRLDDMWTDVAVTADGNYICIVVHGPSTTFGYLTIVDTTTRKVTFSTITNLNPRILAIGSVFYLFCQNFSTPTTLEVSTFDTAASSQNFSAATTVATGASAAPASYAVAPFIGSTDYLIAFPTATGYTWRRFNSANVQQTTTNVVSLANAPVDICGASGESVSVVNVRTANGVELRTFNTAGTLTVGPTNIAPGTDVYVNVGLARMSSTQVVARIFTEAAASGLAETTHTVIATTAAHVLTRPRNSEGVRPVTRPLFIDGRIFSWNVLGVAGAPRPMGLEAASTTTTGRHVLSAVALDGLAKPSFATDTKSKFSAIVQGTDRRVYAAITTFDPRDKTYRSHIVECKVFSGERRQSVEIAGGLCVAGGVPINWDGRLVSELGFETTPVITATSQTSGGSMTLLGTYVYQAVWRNVAANGDVTQSAPSPTSSITLTGGNNSVLVTVSQPYSIRSASVANRAGATTWLDIYRTEAGGSIPRLVASTPLFLSAASFGGSVTFQDLVSDATQQTGNALYTQGADGSVSGRLPLGLASAAELIAESQGKLILGRLERENQAQLSAETRPGEAPSFVNDDVFFVTNAEPLTAIVPQPDARRFFFGRRTIRELLGEGPNASGIGELSEPVLVSGVVGAKNWKSVFTFEYGTLFQADDDKLYLLPLGGGQPINAGEGVNHVLRSYPNIVSVVRHEADELVTFVCRDAAGTDSRLVHLELKTSGLSDRGWKGSWIVDRCAVLEGAQFPEIVGEQIDSIVVNGSGNVLLPVILGARNGDRRIVQTLLEAPSGIGSITAVNAGAGFSNRGLIAGTLNQMTTWELLIASTAVAAVTAVLVTVSSVSAPTNLTVKQWLIRGAHASSACEIQTFSGTSVTSFPLPTLTPTWGSAKSLWLATLNTSSSFGDGSNALANGIPAGFSGITRVANRDALVSGGSGLLSMEGTFCARALEAASLAATFTTQASATAVGTLVAVRPLAAVGAPLIANTQYQGRLVVCTAADVLRSVPDVYADGTSTPIKGEWESADIYPQGTGGNGRHLAIVAIGELLAPTQVYAACSYDGGVNWTNLAPFVLSPSRSFFAGQTYQLQWVPRRRKIERVRIKLVQGDEGIFGAGATQGFAINQVTLWFDDLAGPARGLPRGAASAASTVSGGNKH